MYKKKKPLAMMQFMWTLPNLISLCRIPLAFAFFQENVTVRALAVFFALFSDGLDGYLARRTNQVSRLGTLLDPLTDRIFVAIAMGVFFFEGKLDLWMIVAMFSRDIAIILFGLYLLAAGNLGNYYLRAIWCGKVTTVLQLAVLFGMTLGIFVPYQIFYAFFILGGLALIELAISDEKGQ